MSPPDDGPKHAPATASLPEAIAQARQSAAAEPNSAPAQFHLAALLHAARRLDEAEASYRAALRLDPRLLAALVNLAVLLKTQRRFDEAIDLCRQAVTVDQDHASAYVALGSCLQDDGQTAEAIDAYRRAVELAPTDAAAHYSLGGALLGAGRIDEARAPLERALELAPNDPSAHNNLALCLRRSGDLVGAVEHFREALRIDPRKLNAWSNLASALEAAGRHDEAAESCRQALAIDPRDPAAHVNLASVLRGQGHLAQAREHLEVAVRSDPRLVSAHYNLAIVLQELGELTAAGLCFERALALAPNNAEAHFNRALYWLRSGDYERGWTEYEWRWRRHGQPPRPFEQPRWDGERFAGRTLLLHAEQGLGDTLQFIRYAPLAKARGGTLIAEVQPSLVPLLTGTPGIDRVIAAGEPLPEFDVHAPLMSLPAIFGTRLESVPAEVPYLAPPTEAVERWRAEFAGFAGLKVGLVWHGNPNHARNPWRSIPLAALAPLLRVPGVNFFSLQVGAGREQLEHLDDALLIHDLAPRLTDFVETAAAITNLDLVISCDTAPAHLAGALGVPIWLALRHTPDWRWMVSRDDSPWYPTMRLFRQHQPRDWSQVAARLEQSLRQLRG